MQTLTLNCTNAIIHRKTRLFECLTVEKPICETVNSDFKVFCCGKSDVCKYQLWLEIAQERYSKLHKCNIPPQNTSFIVFCHGKTDQCKCQLWLEIVQMRYSITKYVFLCVLLWKISFVQVPTLTWICTYAKILSQNTSFWVLYSGKPDLCNCQLWH